MLSVVFPNIILPNAVMLNVVLLNFVLWRNIKKNCFGQKINGLATLERPLRSFRLKAEGRIYIGRRAGVGGSLDEATVNGVRQFAVCGAQGARVSTAAVAFSPPSLRQCKCPLRCVYISDFALSLHVLLKKYFFHY
jgi:hypothetical protein